MRPLQVTHSITNRDAASLEKYFGEISKIPMITPDEEIALTQKIREGNLQAISTLTKSNLRFVVSVAKQYQHRGLPLTDLIAEGNIGLIKAAQKFDETKGFKFISYAVWWIRQSIIQAINTKSRIVRLPENKVSQQNKIQKSISQLEQALERSPSIDEVSREVQIAPSEIEQITYLSTQHQSLDTPFHGENMESTLLDILSSQDKQADENIAYVKSLQLEVARCLGSLTTIQKKILCCFFGIGLKEEMNIDDIAKHTNLSTERVRQIKQKAILQLRTGKIALLLKPYLG